MSRPALLRAAVPFVAAPLMASFLLAAPGAQAGPARESVPVLAAPGDDAAGGPVRIEVGRFEPRVVTPGTTLTVTGTLTNTGEETITDLRVRLQRGEVRTTREELAEATRDPDPATTVVAAFRSLPGTLPPGGTLEFSYTVPAAELSLGDNGVYPVLLNLNGTADGDERRVGELPTYVVQQAVVPPATTSVAWLWPLTERSHRDAAGNFVDDGLADAVAPDGRLDRALTVIERLPATPPPGRTAPVPAVSVTLAVDPALVEELAVMADGPYRVDGIEGAGRGTEAAQSYLDRLRAVADVYPLAALPYGDVDIDALSATGLSATLTRALPGTPAGTAQHPLPDDQGDGAAATPVPTAGTGTPSPEAPGARTGLSAGVEILSSILDVDPRGDLAWPAGGALRADAVGTLQEGGTTQIVLGTGALTDGARAVGRPGGAATAHASVTTAAGPLDVLVADPTLGDIVGSAERVSGGPRMAEQRYLAELAVLSLQGRRGTEQTVLVAPPRGIVAGPDGAGAMMADTAGLPWLRPGSLAALSRTPAVDAGELTAPAGAVHLDAAGLAQIAGGIAARDDLAAAVVGDAATALQSLDAAAARATSVAWRADPEGFRGAAADFRAGVDRMRGRVTLLAPADGTYTLASSDSPLVLTVRNDLPFAVRVRLDLSTRGNRRLSISDIGVQELASGERTTLQVPTTVQQAGGFAVTASLVSPDGGPLGDPVLMQVRSTAYGPISLIITIGSAVLLGLLFLRRLVRFLLRRRAAAGVEEPLPSAAEPLPPTRSPV